MGFKTQNMASQQTFDGEIQLILGPMFAGKTTELMRRLKRYTIAKRNVVVLKYAKDLRYDAEKAATHDGQKMEAISCSQLSEPCLDEFNVIGVDEGQFFPDLIEFCERMANQGKIVVVSALDGTFQRQPFGRVLELVPLAEHVSKLNAVCMESFGNAASFSKRIVGGDAIEVIGGADKYVAVCRACFNEVEQHNGEVQMIVGPMFAGKTTELMRRLRRFQVARRSCALIKFSSQTEGASTASGSSGCTEFGLTKLSEADVADYDVIGVDDGQSFEDLASFCDSMADLGKVVIVAALDGDYRRQPFPSVMELIPCAEQLQKLSAVCSFSQEAAAFTKVVESTEGQGAAGAGQPLYAAACRRAFFSAESDSAAQKSSSPSSIGIMNLEADSPYREYQHIV